MLTAQEKRTLFALLDTDNTHATARKIYLSPKTVYTYVRNIGYKLNLRSILQVRQFVFSEFALDAHPRINHPIHLVDKYTYSMEELKNMAQRSAG
jgi:Bacterial regulatory proteins, luxR family.